MSDNKTFIDSNIILNLFGVNQRKKDFASSLKNQNYIISTQVVNENVSVCINKLNLSKPEAFSHGEYLLENFILSQISKSTIQRDFMLCERYEYSYWDSLILSSALENNCTALYLS